MTIRFDDSLPKMIDAVDSALGKRAVEQATFLRDARGQLSVIIDDELSDESLSNLEERVRSELGGYARDDGAARDRHGYGAKRLLLEGRARPKISVGDYEISFLDRRTVGADWLLAPQSNAGVPRIAFASLRGGVGRSTALAVLAAYLSSRGLRVLAVDLDLEAPGIGTMLIDSDAMPKFGTLDYLVENGLSGIDDQFILDCLGSSFLGEVGAQVNIIPAIGAATFSNPAGAISKLSRAYLEDINREGESVSLTAQISEMLDRTAEVSGCDIILVDARAGLHETTAAALLGLGAEILLFGVNEPQTFLGYRLLLAHLMQFHKSEYESWKDRVQFVHAKASGDPAEAADAVRKFRDLYQMIGNNHVDQSENSNLTTDDFEMAWVDEDLSTNDIEDIIYDVDDPSVIKILDDVRYKGFDPLNTKNLLNEDLFELTFSELIEWVTGIIPSLLEVDDGV